MGKQWLFLPPLALLIILASWLLLSQGSRSFIYKHTSEVDLLYNTELDRCWIKGAGSTNYIETSRGPCVIEMGLR